VQTLTTTCGGPSGGATGDYDNPATDQPFQAPSWNELAPGEVEIASAAQQIVAPAVASDAPVGQAFDPISGSGACATASATDQVGAATYRSAAVPSGGFTLMGSATIVADILSPGPTSQLAARLLDVDTGGNETLVARGLYRPTNAPTVAACQVFQLHPNGWKFAEGHVIKLELLPADQPYGRNSNGQVPITVSNLKLRLPVLEQPNGTTIQAPAPKVLPQGYALAAGVPPDVDASCPTPATTTTTSTPVTTTTSTTNTTTTTLPVTHDLTLTAAKIHASSDNGSIRVQGRFTTPPNFSVPPPFGVRVQDGGSIDRLHTFASCTTTSKGRVRCTETSADGVFKAKIGPKNGAQRFKIGFQKQAIAGSLQGPVTMTLTHNSAVVRSDTISACRQNATSLSCKE
jgi:hypothetical protein